MNLYLEPKGKPFYTMAKAVGSTCNLDCTYCYYLEKSKLYPEKSSTLMTDETLHGYIKSYIEAQMATEVMFTWHGGEALLRGFDFYKQALKYQKFYANKHNIQIANTLQTNGILLNDKWCEFFKENNFLIGISIDGPAKLHDFYRKSRSGKPSMTLVNKGLKLLQKHQVEYNILAVVNNLNSQYPLEVYEFFKQSGAKYIQFTPIVERAIKKAAANQLKLTPPETQENVEVTEWSVNPIAYGKFLCAIFDEWVKKDVGTYYVINFDAMLANWMRVPPPICVFAETCGHALAMEHNGDVFACDHYVFPEFKRGNIKSKTLYEMAYSPEQVKFGHDKKDKLPKQCKECKYLFACHGECPKNRISTTKDGESGLNYLCDGFKLFYKHIEPYMEFMVEELHNKRAPANIMKQFRQHD